MENHLVEIGICFIVVVVGCAIKKLRERNEKNKMKTRKINLNGDQRITYRELKEAPEKMDRFEEYEGIRININ